MSRMFGLGKSHKSAAAAVVWAVVGCTALGVTPAFAQVSRDQAAARIAKEYGVEVLRVVPGDVGGTPVWLVTFMEPGGNFNSAFQVSTLAVDRADGGLVPAFRQGVHGTVGTARPTDTHIDRRPDAPRTGTWR